MLIYYITAAAFLKEVGRETLQKTLRNLGQGKGRYLDGESSEDEERRRGIEVLFVKDIID